MIEFAKQPELEGEPGRNDPCPCASGKKYKKCCLKKKQFIDSKVDLSTMLKLLYCFVNGLKGRSVIITKRTVDEYCKGKWQERMNIQTELFKDIECYRVSVTPDEPDPKIITPQSNIILPGQENF